MIDNYNYNFNFNYITTTTTTTTTLNNTTTTTATTATTTTTTSTTATSTTTLHYTTLLFATTTTATTTTATLNNTTTTTATTATTTTTTTTTTIQVPLHYKYKLHHTTPRNIQQLWVRWPLKPLQKAQLQSPFGPSWIRSAIHASQQLTSPIAVYLWNFRHRLVRYYYWQFVNVK